VPQVLLPGERPGRSTDIDSSNERGRVGHQSPAPLGTPRPGKRRSIDDRVVDPGPPSRSPAATAVNQSASTRSSSRSMSCGLNRDHERPSPFAAASATLSTGSLRRAPARPHRRGPSRRTTAATYACERPPGSPGQQRLAHLPRSKYPRIMTSTLANAGNPSFAGRSPAVVPGRGYQSPP